MKKNSTSKKKSKM